ncbi:unnamed protein product [Discosporangium mesarthrocarpum]
MRQNQRVKLLGVGACMCACFSVAGVRAFHAPMVVPSQPGVLYGGHRLPWLGVGYQALRRCRGRAGGIRALSLSEEKTIWDLQGPEEWEFDEEVQKLEGLLDKAISKENYADANMATEKLYRLHMDETSAVLCANAAFYKAFSDKDHARMAELWLKTDDILCLHPGDNPVVGYHNVSASWKELFSSGDKRFMSSVIQVCFMGAST